ncbi:hypothetical protein Adt_45256 [Abeliophyllum distichum]|uniref:Uncharacterized protein n=1 Tax=Abeliophyllum distichum TaxID=126358 RepID=A0ABD1PD70_9LAMI
MLAGLVGEVGKKLPGPLTKNLGLFSALGAEGFQKYVNKSWKLFLSEKNAKYWMEASLACSIRSAVAQIKSLVAMRELKKKAANALEAMSWTNQIKECLDSTVALAESAKLAYEKAMLDMAEAKSQIAILTKKLEDTMNAQKIAIEALEAANGEKHRLRNEASARQEEILKLKTILEECPKGRVEAENINDSVIDEKEDLAKKL